MGKTSKNKIASFSDILRQISIVMIVLYAVICAWSVYVKCFDILWVGVVAIILTIVSIAVCKEVDKSLGLIVYSLPIILVAIALNIKIGWESGSHFLILIPIMLVAFNEMKDSIKRAATIILFSIVIVLKILDLFISNLNILDIEGYWSIDLFMVISIFIASYLLSIRVANKDKGLLKTLVLKNDGLVRMNETDPLTQIYNRAKIESLANLRVAEAQKSDNKNGTVAIGFIDIDKFKQVNDTYSHEAGDEVLRELSRIMRSVMRVNDSAGRWGGEEFIIVFGNVTEQSLLEYDQIIRRKVANTVVNYLEYKIKFTLTIGICMYDEGLDFDSMRKLADEAMYYGKSTGRNRTLLVNTRAKTEEERFKILGK